MPPVPIMPPDGMAYTYNAENRLITTQPQTPADGDTRVEYLYDYMGRRVQKTVYAYGSGSWNQDKEVQFVYDGWNMVKETTIPTGQSAVDKYYVWGLDLSQSLQGAGGLVAAVEGSLTYHYLYDANGNVGQVVDAGDGTIAAHYEYDGFGNEVLASGDLAGSNPYRFSTKYFDQETNLYYYGYRYYDPEMGRWLIRDPLEEDGGLNLYGFVGNEPLNKYDILGLSWTLSSAKKQIRDEIRNWRSNGYIFAANLFEHFLEGRGPSAYSPLASDIAEIQVQGKKKICSKIAKVIGNKKGIVEVDIEPEGDDSNIRWWYVGSNKNMLYAYGGARLKAKGKPCVSGDGAWKETFQIELKDLYEFDKSGLENAKQFASELFSNAYSAAVHLEQVGTSSSFSHEAKFDLECSGSVIPEFYND